jgi:hypothetical protein
MKLSQYLIAVEVATGHPPVINLDDLRAMQEPSDEDVFAAEAYAELNSNEDSAFDAWELLDNANSVKPMIDLELAAFLS